MRIVEAVLTRILKLVELGDKRQAVRLEDVKHVLEDGLPFVGTPLYALSPWRSLAYRSARIIDNPIDRAS